MSSMFVMMSDGLFTPNGDYRGRITKVSVTLIKLIISSFALQSKFQG